MKGGRAIDRLKQMAKHKLRGSHKKQLSIAVGYLQRYRWLMRYDEDLENGYSIGSGVADGTCPLVVKGRAELTGMRWRTIGAQAMLDLCAVFLNGDWDAFQQHRIEVKHCKLYP